MNLYEKLSKIRNLCEVMYKNKSGFSYKYVSIDEILARVTAGMKKYKVSLIPKVVSETTTSAPLHYMKTKTTRDGKIYEEHVNEVMVTGDIVYRWVNNEDPGEYIDVPWFMTGSQTDPSQAFGSAMTYSLRYFLLQFFQIAALDNDDPDSWRQSQKQAETMEDREIAKEIIERVNEMVNEHLSKNPDDREKVIATTKKYAKKNGKASANYFDIEDPITAGNLMEEFTKLFELNEKEK